MHVADLDRLSCSFTPDPDPLRNDQITRATSLVRSALAFSQAIREDRLPLDEVRGRPQCMNQYWWLFGVTRVPGDDGGRIRMDADARHIMILCRGQVYRMDVLEAANGQIIDEGALSRGLKGILEDANSMSQKEAFQNAIGVLTTENQKVWSHCRKALVHERLQNGRNFASIDSSLFALCLDDSSPQSEADVCLNMICGTNVVEHGVQVGTCLNRWYDKLSIIICRNGAAGMNFEHTCTDGSVDISMACDIYRGSISPSNETSNSKWRPIPRDTHASANDSVNGAALPQWQRLAWDIPSDTAKALLLAEAHLISRIDRHQLQTLDFKDYGSTFIKSAGFSPDAFFQMALQAAYYSQYKQIKSGFEPVVTRQFLHGRTDVVRTTTAEVVAFVRIFNQESSGTAEKLEAMHRATDAHVTLSRSCAQGNSHHRHLYVIQQLWKRRQAFLEANALATPAKTNGEGGKGRKSETTIFTDPGWARLNTTVLMGSNVDNPDIAYAGFGPASDDGFTICYYIRSEHMAMSVTSRNGEAKLFASAIERTFKQLKVMLQV